MSKPIADQVALRPAMVAASSRHADSGRAAQAVCEELLRHLDSAAPHQTTSFVLVFFSRHHVSGSSKIAAIIRRRLSPGVLIGCSAESVIAGSAEHEDTPGISVIAGRLPGVTLTPFGLHDLPLVYADGNPDVASEARIADEDESDETLDRLGAACGLGEQHRATLLFADPFCSSLNRLLPAISATRRRLVAATHGVSAREIDACPILGGIASASSRPGGNMLLLGDRVLNSGLVGVSISGAIQVNPLVSQGCRAFGQPMIVTASRGNVLRSLGGKPALTALNAAIEHLNEANRDKLRKGVFVGRVVDEYREGFGRGDFLIRNVMGVSKESGEIAVNDALRVGQTVQFHLRDADSASADLELALDAQRLRAPPVGAILITCNGRGSRMFSQSGHDARALARLFDPEAPAESSAKGGLPIAPASTPAIAGFQAAGEIGPVGGSTFVHGFSACAAIFREFAPSLEGP